MWTRSDLKANAKSVLSKNYWMAFLVSLVYGIISGAAGSATSGSNGSMSSSMASLANTGSDSGEMMALFAAIMAAMMAMIGVIFVISFIASFFLYGPLTVGKNRYYMESRSSKSTFTQLFYGFKNNYMSTALSMFLTELFTSLWTLLFIIPGIIKGLQWSQVGYILAENPEITGARAREISTMMTDGEKWDIFVLQLSFIGWNLLGALACGIGTLFVAPYVEATFAELYAKMRDKALTNGFCTVDELPGVEPSII